MQLFILLRTRARCQIKADSNVILHFVDLAHQLLAKPCEDDDLKATIDRAFIIKKLLDNDAIKQVISKIDALPSVPSLYMELVEELNSEKASIAKIGDIICTRIGLPWRWPICR